MIYFITDKGSIREEMWQECMRQRMKEGVEYIIVRDKGQFNPQRVNKLMAYKKNQSNIQTKIIVHSDLKLAQEVEADGVHLSYTLWKEVRKNEMFEAWHLNKIVGISIHSLEEAQRAEGQVDYMFLSPVFHPSCKPIEGKGISWFKNIKQQISTPLVALGGITPQNVKQLYKEGIDDIAVMSYLMCAKNKLQDLRG